MYKHRGLNIREFNREVYLADLWGKLALQAIKTASENRSIPEMKAWAGSWKIGAVKIPGTCSGPPKAAKWRNLAIEVMRNLIGCIPILDTLYLLFSALNMDNCTNANTLWSLMRTPQPYVVWGGGGHAALGDYGRQGLHRKRLKVSELKAMHSVPGSPALSDAMSSIRQRESGQRARDNLILGAAEEGRDEDLARSLYPDV
uniref:Uncharacterized protein n=1 Tax=Chromera velia CCMP2878 TaxID=1169474 RepID=A0A0G4HVW6_9ALVE|eukprot:Cvel_8947.t1-p1 / transcript=Cvel_8947.t1 / gene=Cvel_8947 / organism=Chromera_velia_CCMP2878 / gene_product=hypothetical protein / transcript_product=hypothetical protein / location=Cvel_scaffold504:24314-26421(+) / protein_length=200 / sequence_SO=supercontig / SO=protein_coding / is_pseudo=false